MDVTELLANCEKEALHLSGQIQSFGAAAQKGADFATSAMK